MKILINGKIEADYDGNLVGCKGCGAPIGYAVVVKSGKKMPFDPRSEDKVSHYATCPQAERFRRKQ